MRKWMAVLVVLAVLASGAMLALLRTPALPETEAANSVALGLLLLDGEDGVYVLAVSAGSAADQAGLQPGDCILRAAEIPLADVAAFNRFLASDGRSTPLTIERNGRILNLRLLLR